jgi:GNAT superfamily N-acetyltransferase
MSELFTIRDARESDMDLVNSYANAEGMDRMPGVERIRVAVNDDDVVVGFCRLQDDVNGIAYVNPIVTYAPWRGYGVGRALIADAHEIAGELRLISRGTSEGFYRKLGFVEMPWEDVDLEAAEEDCDNCPYRAECHPVPMRLA